LAWLAGSPSPLTAWPSPITSCVQLPPGSGRKIYEVFGKVYRRYRAFKRKEVGEFFFNEIDDIVEKLCDDFEGNM